MHLCPAQGAGRSCRRAAVHPHGVGQRVQVRGAGQRHSERHAGPACARRAVSSSGQQKALVDCGRDSDRARSGADRYCGQSPSFTRIPRHPACRVSGVDGCNGLDHRAGAVAGWPDARLHQGRWTLPELRTDLAEGAPRRGARATDIRTRSDLRPDIHAGRDARGLHGDAPDFDGRELGYLDRSGHRRTTDPVVAECLRPFVYRTSRGVVFRVPDGSSPRHRHFSGRSRPAPRHLSSRARARDGALLLFISRPPVRARCGNEWRRRVRSLPARALRQRRGAGSSRRPRGLMSNRGLVGGRPVDVLRRLDRGPLASVAAALP